MKKAGGTTRGVFVVEKQGHVLAAEPGSPAATVEVVRKLVSAKVPTGAGGKKSEATNNSKSAQKKEDIAQANVAAEVAETAQKLDDPHAP